MSVYLSQIFFIRCQKVNCLPNQETYRGADVYDLCISIQKEDMVIHRIEVIQILDIKLLEHLFSCSGGTKTSCHGSLN